MISIDGKVYRYVLLTTIITSLFWNRFMAKDTDLALDVMTQVNLTVITSLTCN